MTTLDLVYTRVEAPPVAPHPYGLFSVAPPAAPGDHGLVGVWWESWACLDPNTTTDPCINGGADPGAKEFEDCPNTSAFKPITVYLGIKRTGQSYDVGEAQVGKALGDAEEFAIERFLWEQLDVTGAEPAQAPVDALAHVELLLGKNYMGTGVIHMSRATAIRLAPQLVRNGDRIETTIGTPVVVGAGYYTDPAAIVGTGAVAVYRGELDVLSAWDTAINDELVLAERTYIVGWDCYSIAALVADPT